MAKLWLHGYVCNTGFDNRNSSHYLIYAFTSLLMAFSHSNLTPWEALGSLIPAGLILLNSESSGPRTFPETQDVLDRYLLSGLLGEWRREEQGAP